MATLILVLIIAGAVGVVFYLIPANVSHGLRQACYGSANNTIQNVNGANSTGIASIYNYDEQWAASIGTNVNSVVYNVTAINQNDSNFNGPAYLVNGYSNDGIWYQLGIFTPAMSYLRSDIFSVDYQTWNSTGVLQSGVLHLSNPINNAGSCPAFDYLQEWICHAQCA